MKHIRIPQTHVRAKPALDIRENVALGVLRLLFSLIFGNRLARIINELETLFEAWRNGTLPPAPEPRVAKTISPAKPRARAPQRHTRARRQRPVARILMRDFRPQRPRAWVARVSNFVTNPLPTQQIFFKNRPLPPGFITPKMFQYRNKKSLFASFSSEKEGLPVFLSSATFAKTAGAKP